MLWDLTYIHPSDSWNCQGIVHSLPLFKGSVVTHEFRSKLPAKQCLANCFKRPQRSFPSKPPTNAIPFRENIRPSSRCDTVRNVADVHCKNAWKRELERTRMAYQHVLKLSEVEQLPAIFSTYSHPTVLTAQKVAPSLLARRLLLVSDSNGPFNPIRWKFYRCSFGKASFSFALSVYWQI